MPASDPIFGCTAAPMFASQLRSTDIQRRVLLTRLPAEDCRARLDARTARPFSWSWWEVWRSPPPLPDPDVPVEGWVTLDGYRVRRIAVYRTPEIWAEGRLLTAGTGTRIIVDLRRKRRHAFERVLTSICVLLAVLLVHRQLEVDDSHLDQRAIRISVAEY